ncbi:tetratricopeptide repeat protein [Allorhodopirellula heiligendammensis]|uniref:Tetratricopeptide repeat protein n=1 Tax=Allorhodopirellula heiligendammensis TaxID=2714739 RepID=A0A5C6C3Y2_9BACT|nr:tetratricopeptide repeat protein [Allorhodopirellula heiligendammensis]TWU19290.1 Tetratricopeptide repeat protein [Allorhodopirellula heiligendammensis]
MSSVSTTGTAAPVPRKKYVRAVGPRLRKLLYFIFVLVALLFANSGYLSIFTFLEWFSGKTYQDFFYQYMFLAHLVLGLLLILPLVIFGLVHTWNTKDRRNRRAVRIGYVLLGVSMAILVTGILLVRIGGFDLKQPLARNTVYWLHVACPLAAVWLYWLHRLAGPRIKWRIGMSFAAVAVAAIAVMVVLQMQDPRQWNAIGPDSGVQYFEPSLARTASGNFIPAEAMMNDDYCLKCHADIHRDWQESVHHFSSFNNEPYLASVSATRAMSLERDGSVQASRWCAGCHDPVPFFSGAFDDPEFDMLKHPTARAGITCTVCHTITNVNSVRGNADYTIEEPLHYPFANSENAALQWINNQLVKAKPSFHKKTFLKPFHKTAEFCSTCHKVHLPMALNGYKEFLRGQNHYDPYLFSGVSGHGARSFYYPPKAVDNCNECHMPLVASDDFGAKHFDGAAELSVHDHMFPSANTGIAWLRDRDDIIAIHQEYLQDIVRVDIFGIREGGEIDGELIAPLRPQVPTMKPGGRYLIESVVRTLKLGHLFTQGTVDSNEVWLQVNVTSGDRVIGRSGMIDPENGNEVDPWSHFINVFMLDKDGNRISRRNPENIFTPLYNHQIPPGAGQTVHFELEVPDDVTEPIQVELKLLYRKFDTEYMDFVAKTNADLGQPIRGYEAGKRYVNNLPITTMAVDTVEFPVESADADANRTVQNPDRDIPQWQRWNDYGIGLLLKGKAELRQAEEAFTQVEKLGRYDGPLNLARVLNSEGRLDEAVDALQRAAEYQDTAGFPRWTWAWLSGDVNAQQGRLEEAEQNLRSVLDDNTAEMQKRGFDFSIDIVVINLLGRTLFDLGNVRERQQRPEESILYFREAVAQFEKTLTIDPEDVSAHHNLQLLFEKLGDHEQAEVQRKLHQLYKPDDNAAGRAIRLAREKYPAANHAAEAVVKYSLNRDLPAARQDDPQDGSKEKINETQATATDTPKEVNDVQ